MPQRNSNNIRNQFEEIFLANYRVFFSIGYRICGDKEFTKDTIQGFFVELWEKQIWQAEVGNLPAYLNTSFYRKMIYEWKQHKKRLDSSSNSDFEVPVPSYEELMVAHEEEQSLQKSIQDALEQLPEKQREMLDLRFKEGMEYDEIASSTGKSRQTIYNQIHAAVKKLRNALLSLPPS